MIKGIVFDLDGTLLNTLKDIRTSINITLEHFDYKPINNKKTKDSVGYGSQELVRRVLPLNTTADRKFRIFQHYLKTYDEVSGKYTKPYRGIIKLIEELKRIGYKLAITSNKSDHLVQELNEKLFNNLFDVTLGIKKGIPAKPNPKIINEALKRLELTNEEAIYIGDTEVDIRTANNAKLKVVAVTWGFRESDDLRLLHPDYVISRPKQLLRTISVINNK